MDALDDLRQAKIYRAAQTFYGPDDGRKLHAAGMLRECEPDEMDAVRKAGALRNWTEDRAAFMKLTELLHEAGL